MEMPSSLINFERHQVLVLKTSFSFNGKSLWRVLVEYAIVIEAPVHENCHWDIQTQENRILVITALNGNLKDAQEFLTIHDGSCKDSPILLVENQKNPRASDLKRRQLQIYSSKFKRQSIVPLIWERKANADE
ncbi:hypothetical protein OUZ56_014715 [Daphnia magna]|uniref:Uncharacterized protein n=1 Tax=Daphnia magna TaxID=35525 RepID=A0ABR0AKL3_9CRUS|nr:hypothetical protein OUZ56_014715 [Daphnia magna]